MWEILYTAFVGVTIICLSGFIVWTLTRETREVIYGILCISAVIGMIIIYDSLSCNYWECCDDGWIVPRIDKLASELERNVYGQHLAIEVITQRLQEHTTDSHPEKPLVLSMHGSTGTGKNYIGHFVVDNFYREGYKSKFVHLFVATVHFPHQIKLCEYREYLRSFIVHKVTECSCSMFIFDEVEKMPLGLIDSVMDYLYQYFFNKLDFTKAMFLFISNSAGTDINRRMLEHLKAGHKREEVTVKEMEEIIRDAALKDLWYTNLAKSRITAFVPFLPLESHHVKACIRDEMIRKYPHAYLCQNKENFVNMMLDEFIYFPEDSKLFSTSGCKRVSEIAAYILD